MLTPCPCWRTFRLFRPLVLPPPLIFITNLPSYTLMHVRTRVCSASLSPQHAVWRGGCALAADTEAISALAVSRVSVKLLACLCCAHMYMCMCMRCVLCVCNVQCVMCVMCDVCCVCVGYVVMCVV